MIFLDLIRNAKRVETLFTAMGILSSVHRINASYQGWVVSEIRVQFVFAPGAKSVGCPKLD